MNEASRSGRFRSVDSSPHSRDRSSLRVLGGVVRQPVVLGPAPHPLVGVGVRGVAGEVLGHDLRVLRQVRLHHPRPLVDLALVPEDRHRPRDLAPQLGQEGHRVLAVGVGVVGQQPEVRGSAAAAPG